MRRSDVAVVRIQPFDGRDVAAFRRAIAGGFRRLKDSDAVIERSREALARAYQRLDRKRTTIPLPPAARNRID